MYIIFYISVGNFLLSSHAFILKIDNVMSLSGITSSSKQKRGKILCECMFAPDDMTSS